MVIVIIVVLQFLVHHGTRNGLVQELFDWYDIITLCSSLFHGIIYAMSILLSSSKLVSIILCLDSTAINGPFDDEWRCWFLITGKVDGDIRIGYCEIVNSSSKDPQHFGLVTIRVLQTTYTLYTISRNIHTTLTTFLFNFRTYVAYVMQLISWTTLLLRACYCPLHVAYTYEEGKLKWKTAY